MIKGKPMGYSRARNGRDGKPRYTAYYWDIRGRERSAGTFSSKKEADKAWQREEAKVSEGRAGDPLRGRQLLQRYVLDEWLPNHQMEARTRENYTYYLDSRILPWFGAMRMIEVMPADVREWITHLKNEDVSSHVIRYCMTVLSAIFTTALNDVIHLHPVRGIKPPPVPKKKRAIITPEQFDKLYVAICSDTMKLLVETDIESGMRWGELTELRPRDLDFDTGVVTVRRVAVELPRRFHPEGGRFLVKDYPKDGEYREFKLSPQIVQKIGLYIAEHGIGPDDLLFAMPELAARPLRVLANPDTLGLTTPNAAGRRYQHGTLSGYSAGKCRCEHCRGAYALYRAQRRAAGNDQPRGCRTVETDGHIPRWWFRTHVWLPAIEAADLPISVKVHGLRHAHASWLLAGGADIEVVKERLGHASIITTQKYLGTLDEADETAIDALSRIRNRSKTSKRSARRSA
jgi:integrase